MTEKAYDLGNVYAAKNLASLYEEGMGVKQDFEQALKYFLKCIALEGVKEKICGLISLKSEISWESDLHKYWPKLEKNLNGEILKLEEQIFILLCITKYRNRALFAPTKYIVKGICMKILKCLCNDWRNEQIEAK